MRELCLLVSHHTVSVTRTDSDHLLGEPGKVGEFYIGQGKVREIRKNRGNCGLPVVCYRSCDSHQVNTT